MAGRIKGKGGFQFQELEEDPHALHHDDDAHGQHHEEELEEETVTLSGMEDVSLSGASEAWAAAAARRGGSDKGAAGKGRAGGGGGGHDLHHPPPGLTEASSIAALATTTTAAAVAAAAAAKRGGGAGGRWYAPPPGWPWLVVTVLLASMHPAVLAWLMYRNDRPSSGQVAFTPVSILGAGNFLGLLVAVRAFWRDLLKLGSLGKMEWGALVLTALSGQVLAAFYLVDGLRLTSVPVATVLSRLDAAFLLLLSTLLYRDTQTCHLLWSWGNALLLAVGGVVVAFTKDPRIVDGQVVADGADHMPSVRGSGFLVFGALFAAFTQLATRKMLQHVPLGIIVNVRLAVAFTLFHLVALAYGGPTAVRGIYHPRLWVMLLWYAPLFVWGLQYAWLRTIRQCPPSSIAYGLATLLVLELLWCRVILRQPLTFGESIAAGLVLTATLSALTERWYRGDMGWAEEDEGAPPTKEQQQAQQQQQFEMHAASDIEEAKTAPGVTMAAPATLRRRRAIDTTGVAPGREVSLRHKYV